ncbi:MAG: TatD family hydrolase [Methanobrevibacter sp.]|uniref:TatD family hydrolase n=1 Tax=Methanobrevibacter sp. TaxID=66852 RepID=UPI0026DFF616|nr:TatD family hydrolase [Methanobrevibacter sp.]MDO5848877.1 TatD family hydrolase [Methanobrevibacter sp.]
MIDTHIHADARSSEDFEQMYLSGIDSAITCAFYPYDLFNETVLLNHLEKILNYDTARAKKYGLDLKVALGIHPSNCDVKPELIYENLYKWIENKDIVAIGEIGLENLTDNEIEVFKKQLEIGDETKTKVIVHTPRKQKAEVLKVINEIIPEHIDEKLVVIDHINPAVVEDVIDRDYTLGLTVQPQKMEKEDAIAILNEYGFDRFLLNSDISNMPSNPLSVPETVRELQKQGFENKKIERVAFKNAKEFFNI